MRYLLFDQIGKRYRTNFGWIFERDLLYPNEHLMAFSSRKACEDYIRRTQMINTVSFGISSTSHLYKLSHILYG